MLVLAMAQSELACLRIGVLHPPSCLCAQSLTVAGSGRVPLADVR